MRCNHGKQNMVRRLASLALVALALLASLAASADLDAHHSEIAAYAKATEPGYSDEEMAKYDKAFHDPMRVSGLQVIFRRRIKP